MENCRYRVLGVMSGTSLDGIDLAECELTCSEESGWTYKLGVTETIAYPSEWKSRLGDAINFSTARLSKLNEDYSFYLGHVISDFIARNELTELNAVCSHGHTVLHQPDEGITLQIGNIPEIANYVGQTVVCDFRVQDVKLGGQGAPLVPIGDRLLFGDYDYCLNLGGFANVSSEGEHGRIAYDICPVNIVLNHYSGKLGKAFDEGGRIAASGIVDDNLLQKLNDLAYYKAYPPKSLGLEWVKKQVFPLMDSTGISERDLIATFTEHIAVQLAAQFHKGAKILITGGGTYNDRLIERLKYYKQATFILPSQKIIEYKEALVFALLGVLKLRDEVNCLASVTGAKHDHSGGMIYSEMQI